MNYANLFLDDTVNGIGFRTSLFVSGCAKHPPCKGCWSPYARNFDYGRPFTNKTKEIILESLSKPYTSGVSILGGEPMDNLEDGTLLDLVKTVRKQHPNKTIFCWSGYTFQELIKRPLAKEFLQYIDMLRDGAFIEELKDVTQCLGGSKNQRCVNCKLSLEKGEVILYSFE